MRFLNLAEGFSSVIQSSLTLCDPMDHNTPGLLVHHHLPEFTQTHVLWVGDAIQPTHPLSSPSPPTFNLFSIRVFSKESVSRIRWPKYWSFSFSISPPMNIQDSFPLGLAALISLLSKGLSRDPLVSILCLSGYSIQFSSISQSCPTLCNPMNRSTPGLPVHHQLPEFTQTHVHRVSDAIQPSHPLSSPYPPAFNISQHQGLFKWVSSSHQVAKVLAFQL